MEERIKVLSMLEDGKINAEEASKLLSLLNQPTYADHTTEDRLQHFAQDVNRFAKEVGCKAKNLYKSAEPKIKKASQTALENVAVALDNLASKINDSLEKTEDAGGSSCCTPPVADDTPVEN